MKNPINMVNKTLYMFPFVFPNIKIAKPTGIYSKDHCIEKTVPVSIAFTYSGKRVIKVSRLGHCKEVFYRKWDRL